MKNRLRMMQGFSLIELVITFSVITVLGAIAWPSYKDYLRRSYFNELITVANAYKTEVTSCYEQTHSLKECNAGKHDINPVASAIKGAVKSLTVNAGVITITPVAAKGILATDTYILTPSIVNKKISWTSSGVGVERGYNE